MGRDVRIQLAGSYKTRNADAYNFIERDHRYINYYRRTVVDPVTGSAKDFLEKRLGWSSVSDGGASRYGQSIIEWLGYPSSALAALFAATDGSDIYVYSSVPSTGGTISVGSTPSGFGLHAFITETIISGVATLLISINQTLANSLGYTCIGGAAPAAMGGSFPTDAIGPITPAYGFNFVMTRGGNLHNSPINATTWAAADYIPVQSIPDAGVGAWRTGDFIAAFGKRSIEIFGNAGRDTNSPLLRVEGSSGVIPIGAPGVNWICDAGGMIAFVGVDYQTGNVGVYLLVGAQIKKISTPVIDNIIGNKGGFGSNGLQSPRLCVWVMNGEKFLSIDFTAAFAADLHLCCQLSNQFWFEYTSPSNVYPSAACGGAGYSRCVTQTNSNSDIYTMSDTQVSSVSYQDDGAAVSSSVQVAGIDLGTNVDKTLNSLELIGDTQVAASAHTVDISTDDAQNFTNVGTLDMNTQHRRLTGLGSFQRLGVKVTHAVNGPSRLEALDLNVTKFGH